MELVFDPAAIGTVAREAVKSAAGARGLRTILENVMLDIMYEVPFLEGIKRCRITADVVLAKGNAELVFENKKSEIKSA